ncbi:class I SAM-dependent methyltransferase [Fructobacillus sp. M2-14]|uniref:Class I SAM-dependent methyltransferase n=1 Tax=Fructobacillus broussonetiae TaxID=2713173 RepID=A0ABS5R3L9_9LACO|nr:class I SAM-dependent methyltransferase [Fructobacillus broussonetiae]MBS9338757.1 class I SAM-dependent methyltransferase [Fructobacillus broussonetiae]
MTKVNVPEIFQQIQNVVDQVVSEEKVNVRQALIQTLATLNEQKLSDKDKEMLSENSQKALGELFKLDWSSFSYQDKRHILQLLVLKADKEDKVPANNQLTPDGIGYLLGDLVEKTANLNKKNGEVATLTDMTVGTGNLLWTVQETLAKKDIKVQASGIDGSEEQLALASVLADLLGEDETELFLGDVVSLPKNELQPADAVIADLPIGYYPNEAPEGMVTAFSKEKEDEKSYAHFLMIEKSLDLIKEDGWAYLVVPANLLSAEKRESILKLLSTKAQLKAFLTLPQGFFKNKNQQKAILVLRHQNAQPKTEVMLGQYPSVKESQALEEFLQDLGDWGKLNKENVED